jgi:pyruvate carboxylase subunit A/acetyl-CoA carboxylase biotin carboxylase subunit
MPENDDDEMMGALAATIMYASEYLQISSDLPTYKNDKLNVWVLNKRLNY